MEQLNRQRYNDKVEEIRSTIIKGLLSTDFVNLHNEEGKDLQSRSVSYKDTTITFNTGSSCFTASTAGHQDMVSDNALHLATGIASLYYAMVGDLPLVHGSRGFLERKSIKEICGYIDNALNS